MIDSVHSRNGRLGCQKRWAGHVKLTREEYAQRQKESKRRQYQRDPERFRHYELVQHYGITLEQYQDLEKQQKGLCAICGKPPLVGKRAAGREAQPPRLCVDHDHETGKVRGLLCHWCNSHVVAGIEKSGASLQKIAEYLGINLCQ